MIRNRIASFAALCAVAFVLGPARAEPPVEGKIDDSKREMVELLKKIELRLATAEARSDVALELITKDIKQLREEVSRLQKEVGELRKTGPGTTTSNYPSTSASPSTNPAVAPPAPVARVRLVNNYFTEMTAVVNGKKVTVPPNQFLDVIVPPGPMIFDVPQTGWLSQLRTLAVNERLTLTMGPISG